MLKFLHEYDIIWISETKHVSTTNIPGFVVYHNVSHHGKHRGGIMLLVKCDVQRYLLNVNMNLDSQIWLELSFLPGVYLAGVYIPPDDSRFYDQGIVANISAQIKCKKHVIILGDFNARTGKPKLSNKRGEEYDYINISDNTLNTPGKRLLNMCTDNSLVIANHLNYNNRSLGGNLSFKKGNVWISELDLCLAHEDLLPMIEDVKVRQEVGGSDHAPLCISLGIEKSNILTPFLLDRAKNLGQTYTWPLANHDKLPRTQPSRKVNMVNFNNFMANNPPPALPEFNIEIALNESFKIISEGAKNSRLYATGNDTNSWEYSHPRWKRLVENNDSKTIWKAINWKGDINEKDTVKPADEHFKFHFENLLNIDQPDCSEIQFQNSPYIPVLDDPFTLPELDIAVKDLKTEKSYTGICPGIFVNLPLTWLIFFLTLFNVIFQNLSYPAQWTYSKLITLFKSGNRMDCGNYRGISIMDTLAKVYDKLLLNRLTLWSDIDKSQAGAQKNRGCIEQIMTLRLLMDFAKFKKKKLYLLFIDFSKAYDKVPRNKLLEYMKSLGCGRTLLYAIKNMYKCTYNVLNSIKISTSSGVRQGAPTSCLLFIIYVDKMIKIIKEAVPLDGFLGSLHVLMLMDDTVVMTTSR